MSQIGFVFVLVISWALPLYGLVNNQLNPTFNTAMGVPFSFLFGSGLHFVSMLIWFIIRRSNATRVQVIFLIGSFIVMLVLTAVADSGAISKF